MIETICGYLPLPRSEAWGRLTQAQIAARCRARAETAIALAEDTRGVNVALLETAEAWMQLAGDIEWAAEKTVPVSSRAANAVRQLGKVT